MDLAQIGSMVTQIGVGATALFLFIVFFLDKYKKQEKQIESQMSDIKAQFEKREEQYKDRERLLVAEFAEREGILRRESEKRESIIREDAIRREASLLTTIDGFGKTMKEIASTMTGIKNTILQIQNKIGRIEDTFEKLSKEGMDNG